MTQADVLFSEIPNLIFYCCAGDSFLINISKCYFVPSTVIKHPGASFNSLLREKRPHLCPHPGF